MRILLSGRKLEALRKHLLLEGDEIVEQKPDLVITDDLKNRDHYDCPFVGGDSDFHPSILSDLEFSTPIKTTPGASKLVVFRWFDMGWHPQTILGIPLVTLFNEDLGPACETGMTCTTIGEGPLVELFENKKLEELLKTELRYLGFVVITLGITEDGLELQSIKTTVSFDGFFTIMEARQDKISSFINGESSRLWDSWSSSLRLSRFPWPLEVAPSRSFIKGISPLVEKHLWFYGMKSYNKSWYADESDLGLATAWSSDLKEVTRRCRRSLRHISLENKVFRTDQYLAVLKVLEMLRDLNLISGCSNIEEAFARRSNLYTPAVN